MHDGRITWTTCPRCGDRAALGWRITTGRDGAVREDPVSFHCNVGCTQTDLQFLHWFPAGVPDRAPGSRAGPRTTRRLRVDLATGAPDRSTALSSDADRALPPRDGGFRTRPGGHGRSRVQQRLDRSRTARGPR
ncbi:hypothetical protein Gobs01_03914 [Geodermatophilus obscurus DSM 43160]|uniref:Uncharacterized protein n=1 Tax=Geodermatophilus obscurus (strain ATCC 25078 / DSM 43160 / JCM 3152 / CCUG 61914 / KCC A-0152 / KCTC 9177 / NBRC 13315 / NRRL B-3577 / G-20) TaxID=526225 RepID=D2S6P0_GEOOG|nr:hypothetical protein Gobs_2784 [Geodermatophilus obscurus DSM 43160]